MTMLNVFYVSDLGEKLRMMMKNLFSIKRLLLLKKPRNLAAFYFLNKRLDKAQSELGELQQHKPEALKQQSKFLNLRQRQTLEVYSFSGFSFRFHFFSSFQALINKNCTFGIYLSRACLHRVSLVFSVNAQQQS